MKSKERDVALCPASRRGTRRGAGHRATAVTAFDPPTLTGGEWEKSLGVTEDGGESVDAKAAIPSVLAASEGRAPLTVIKSHFVARNGRLEEHLIREGTGGNLAFIDQLTFVFHRATIARLMGSRYEGDAADHKGLYSNHAVVVSHYLEEIFGFGISGDRGKPANFYSQSYQLGDKKRSYGLVCMGGNKNTICVELTATGLGAAKDGWEYRLHQFAQLSQVVDFRFTRVDVARDFMAGEMTVEEVLDAYNSDGFTLSVTRPHLRKEGLDWYNDTRKGRTLYIGSRQSSRLLRAYEKGKQLGDEESAWLRVELELRSRDLNIPIDILLSPGDYLAAYPAFAGDPRFQSAQPRRIAAKQRAMQAGIEHAVKYLRMQGSKAINMLLGLGLSAEEVITVFDRGAGVPEKVHPGRYFCQLLGINFIHREPDVIPV